MRGARAADHYAQGYSMIDMLQRGKRMLGKHWNEDWEQILPRYL